MAKTQTADQPAQVEEDPITAEDQAKLDAHLAEAKPTLDTDFLASPFTLDGDAELVKATQPQRERNAKQTQMDGVVAKAHARWVEVGKPSVWGKIVETKSALTYFVQPELAADLKKVIGRAGTFHGLRIRYGTSFLVTEGIVSKYNLPADYVGREVVSFAVMDRRPRATATNGNAPAE